MAMGRAEQQEECGFDYGGCRFLGLRVKKAEAPLSRFAAVDARSCRLEGRRGARLVTTGVLS